MKSFAITGVGGFVAPRHLAAINGVGGTVVAAFDPNDSVGILDSYNLGCEYFREYEVFERYMEFHAPRLGNRDLDGGTYDVRGFVDFLSVCSPNYLHDVHVRLGLRTGCNVICEKPLVIAPHNLDELRRAEERYGKRVFTILQLRLHPEVIALKKRIEASAVLSHEATISYVTPRGHWYDRSWKGDEAKSGGVAMNIGVHLFDLMSYLFGPVEQVVVHRRQSRCAAGVVRFARATVKWFLSVDESDLPFARTRLNTAHRVIEVDGERIDLSAGFAALHTESYKEILAGRGFGIEEARPSIELIQRIRDTPVDCTSIFERHPFAR